MALVHGVRKSDLIANPEEGVQVHRNIIRWVARLKLFPTFISKYLFFNVIDVEKRIRGHTELNHGPLDLQSNALPLSYTPASHDTSVHICIKS